MRPYTLGKKSNLASRYVAILFNSTLSVFNDRKNGADASGGGSRIRTGDFLLAKQALYQLSYAPSGGPDRNRTCDLVLIRDAL